jgi:hypothetical protein
MMELVHLTNVVVRACTMVEKTYLSLSPPHHLEKAQEITCTMHYLLLSSLAINLK